MPLPPPSSAPSTQHPAPPRLRRACRRRGFTLTEILVVIIIIVLILGMAIPALRFITGSRSQAGAANMIAAMLARARNDAIGLQIPTGVAFYQDATTGRTMMAEVQQVQFSMWVPDGSASGTPSSTLAHPIGQYVTDGAGNYYVCFNNIAPNQGIELSNTKYWTAIAATFGTSGCAYDQIVGTTAQPLPSGVGVQVLYDSGEIGGAPIAQDRYLHVGAVLFDASGRLITQQYAMSMYGSIGVPAGFSSIQSGGTQNGARDIAQNAGTVPAGDSLVGTGSALYSSVGIVTFDADSLRSLDTPNGDYIINSAASGSQPAVASYGTSTTAGTDAYEESWLDAHATPLLVDRYNGTLMANQ